MEFAEALTWSAAEYGIVLSARQQLQLLQYYDLLLSWNQKVNLTAITQPQEVAVKHMIDSLSCYVQEFFPVGAKVVDVGTGAGFPGLPLKVLRPDLELTLLDSLQKRLAFLQAVVTELGLSGIKLVHARAEDAGRNKAQRGKYQIALSRAVARLNVLCELCLPLLAPGGCFIALKGAQYEVELQEAKIALQLLGGEVVRIESVTLPGLTDKRAVIFIRKIGLTAAAYPRRAGLPEKKPLLDRKQGRN